MTCPCGRGCTGAVSGLEHVYGPDQSKWPVITIPAGSIRPGDVVSFNAIAAKSEGDSMTTRERLERIEKHLLHGIYTETVHDILEDMRHVLKALAKIEAAEGTKTFIGLAKIEGAEGTKTFIGNCYYDQGHAGTGCPGCEYREDCINGIFQRYVTNDHGTTWEAIGPAYRETTKPGDAYRSFAVIGGTLGTLTVDDGPADDADTEAGDKWESLPHHDGGSPPPTKPACTCATGTLMTSGCQCGGA